jgi:hypothetical protein
VRATTRPTRRAAPVISATGRSLILLTATPGADDGHHRLCFAAQYRARTRESDETPRAGPGRAQAQRGLAAVIRAEIRRAGPIDFRRWMQLALYAPGLGYYSAGRAKFGAAGDFVTAPELGRAVRALPRGARSRRCWPRPEATCWSSAPAPVRWRPIS